MKNEGLWILFYLACGIIAGLGISHRWRAEHPEPPVVVLPALDKPEGYTVTFSLKPNPKRPK